MNSQEYWDHKIIEWEDSQRGNQNISFIEKLASYFRGPVKFRTQWCLEILEKFVNDKTILELGCGSGYVAFELYKRGQPKHITGIDISHNAIERAQNLSRDRNLTGQFTFLESEAVSATLPATDITIGLGFLDYLTADETRELFNKLRSRYFLFTFVEKKVSLFRYIHIAYLWSQKCPKHYYYSKEEMLSFISKNYGKVKFLNDPRLSFGCITHNLPDTVWHE